MTTDPTNTSLTQEQNTPLVPTLADLRAAYEQVVTARGVEKDVRDLLALHRQEWEYKFAGLISESKKASEMVIAREAAARALAIAAYEADPGHRKDVLPGCLGIREVVAVGYDPEAALAWAKEHAIAVRLDERAYEKLVKQGLAPGSLSTRIVATIAPG